MSMPKSLDVRNLQRSSRDDRARQEADGKAWTDGRSRRPRRSNRTVAMTLRFSEERRQQIDRLAAALNLSFVELFEKGLDMLDQQTKGKST